MISFLRLFSNSIDMYVFVMKHESTTTRHAMKRECYCQLVCSSFHSFSEMMQYSSYMNVN